MCCDIVINAEPVRKKFGDGKFYYGQVVEWHQGESRYGKQIVWDVAAEVLYEDGDSEIIKWFQLCDYFLDLRTRSRMLDFFETIGYCENHRDKLNRFIASLQKHQT